MSRSFCMNEAPTTSAVSRYDGGIVARAEEKSSIEKAVDQLAAAVPLVAVKRGEQGALARRGREEFTSPAARADFVDPVGAGDSFNAGFIHQFLRGADIPTCLAWGNRAGAFSTTRPGGTEAFRDREHFRKFFAASL